MDIDRWAAAGHPDTQHDRCGGRGADIGTARRRGAGITVGIATVHSGADFWGGCGGSGHFRHERGFQHVVAGRVAVDGAGFNALGYCASVAYFDGITINPNSVAQEILPLVSLKILNL